MRSSLTWRAPYVLSGLEADTKCTIRVRTVNASDNSKEALLRARMELRGKRVQTVSMSKGFYAAGCLTMFGGAEPHTFG